MLSNLGRVFLQRIFRVNILFFIVCASGLANTNENYVRQGKKPNIVFILTDDQDVVLGGMTPLKKTRKLIGDHGITFENMFVTSPLCCPSRSSILTGQYVHNHHTKNDSVSGGCSSTAWQRGPEKKTFNTYLKSMNYRTFFAGKYLNQYGKDGTGGPEHVPPGWDFWYGLLGNSKYYDYILSVNGKPEIHHSDYKTDYLTDVLARQSVKFIKNQSESSAPFFMMVSTPSCHAPFTPAPQYSKMFNTSKAPRKGSYNKAGGPTKHWLIRNTPHPMAASSVEDSDKVFQNRWRTLLSVDDLVEQVLQTLEEEKLLENTFVLFSSDNGYHLGQFSLPRDKRQLYEFDIRVPLLIRGPGVVANHTNKNPVLNIDIAPTVIELAGGKAPSTMDGKSFVPFLKTKSPVEENSLKSDVTWRSDFLVSHFGEGKPSNKGCPHVPPGFASCEPDCVCEDTRYNTYACVRTLSSSADTMYCEFRDKEAFVEIYDLKKDPSQLTNIVKQMSPAKLKASHERLMKLATCAGSSCP